MTTPTAGTRKRGRRRRVWWAGAAGIAAVGVVAGLVAAGVVAWPFAASSSTAADISTLTITTAQYQVTVAGPGTLEAARTLAVTNATAGTIAKLASVGQRVQKGDVLAQLDPTPFQRALRDANLALQKAEAQRASLAASQGDTAASLAKQLADAQAEVTTQERAVQRANDTLALQQRLLTLGAVSASDVQTARDDLASANSDLSAARRALSTLQDSQKLQQTSQAQDLKNAELAVQQQQIAVEQAQEDLDSITTIAPFDGVVASVATEVGAYVPEDGTVLTLIDDSTLDLPAQIDETEISKVKVGQTATVTLDAMPNQTFHGTVTAIAPTGEAVSNIPIFEVTVTLDNQALTLRPGMTAEADIAVRTVANAATVPLTALKDVSGGTQPSTTSASGGQPAGAAAAGGGQASPAPTAAAAGATTAGATTAAVSTTDQRILMVQQPDGSFAPRVVELVDSSGYNAVVTGELHSGDVVLLSASTTATSSSSKTSSTSRSSGSGGLAGLGGGPGMGPPGGMP